MEASISSEFSEIYSSVKINLLCMNSIGHNRMNMAELETWTIDVEVELKGVYFGILILFSK